ncbi:GNAT family N-acetyltransferase [Vibrio mexicanus]|uniref:GNAT family N-acetyltransferase n=1 Tax=Vibrio mexicanus TaxID=1004326 RepID=UPI00063C283F|nr:GNAT family N-acetyltransferase [Vibrio mexicanus]
MQYQYINDKDVSPELDQKLRDLLSRSFLNGQDPEIFSRQRYYKEAPAHRYLLWDGDILAAHIATHEKQVEVNGETFPISGIAEVCVNTDYRGKGLIKKLLPKVHEESRARGDAFSVLFGEVYVYSSSGYQLVDNIQLLNQDNEWETPKNVMVLPLNETWPKSEVKLLGLPF